MQRISDDNCRLQRKKHLVRCMSFCLLLGVGILVCQTQGFAQDASNGTNARAEKWANMSPEQKALLKQRMEKWRELDTQTRDRICENVKRYRKLSSEDRQVVRENWQRWKDMPAETQNAFRHKKERWDRLSHKERRRLRENVMHERRQRRDGVGPRESAVSPRERNAIRGEMPQREEYRVRSENQRRLNEREGIPGNRRRQDNERLRKQMNNDTGFSDPLSRRRDEKSTNAAREREGKLPAQRYNEDFVTGARGHVQGTHYEAPHRSEQFSGIRNRQREHVRNGDPDTGERRQRRFPQQDDTNNGSLQWQNNGTGYSNTPHNHIPRRLESRQRTRGH